jgi:hypothetical protein
MFLSRFANPKYTSNEIYTLYQEMINEVKEGKIPKFTMYNDEELKNFSSRHEYTKVSWSVATAEVAKQISDNVKGMNIHGIYSGSGLLEELIHCCHDKPVVAIDIKGNNVDYRFRDIIESKASASIDMIDDVPNTCLFMSWPTYKCEDVTEAVTKYRNKGGKKIIFIGEGYGDCTGCDSLWENEFNKYWDEEKYILIPQWEGLHDLVKIYVLN